MLVIDETHRAASRPACTRRRPSNHPQPKHASARPARCRAARRPRTAASRQVTSGFRPFAAQGRVDSVSYNNPINKQDPLGLRPCDKEFTVNGKKLSCDDIADAYVDAVSSELQFSFLFPLVRWTGGWSTMSPTTFRGPEALGGLPISGGVTPGAAAHAGATPRSPRASRGAGPAACRLAAPRAR